MTIGNGWLEHAALLEGDEAVVAEDDVVEELNAEESAALVEAEGDAAVFGAGAGVAAGVVVDDDDGGGAGDDGVFEHLARVDEAAVKDADGDDAGLHHAVLGVEQEAAEVLLLQVAHLGHEEVGDVLRGADAGLLVGA